MVCDNNIYYYSFDGLGSVNELTDLSQNIIENYSYSAFGKLEISPEISNSYTYTAREYDQESELYFYRARYYYPKIGRFFTNDPILNPRFEYIEDLKLLIYNWRLLELIDNPRAMHNYTYVSNNSISKIDPSGLKWKDPTSWPFPGTNYCGWTVSGPGPIKSCIDACCQRHDNCLKNSKKSCLQLWEKAVWDCHINLIRCWGACIKG